MKTAIIIIHCIGIVAGVLCAAEVPNSVKVWSGIACACANGVGTYLSSQQTTTQTKP